MQFESKQKRMYWLNAALGIIPDSAIAFILSYAMDGGIIGFFFALIGLQAIYLALWIKNSLWAWAVFKLYGRKYIVSNIADYLRRYSYPEPSEYEKSAEGYLSDVMSDEQQSIMLRLQAAASLAELKFVSSSGQMQNSIRLSMAYEEALENHKKSFLNAV